MKRHVSNARKIAPKEGCRNPKVSLPLAVRSALMRVGLTLAAWGRAQTPPISRTEISLALHGHRRTAKSRRIVAALKRLLEGGGCEALSVTTTKTGEQR